MNKWKNKCIFAKRIKEQKDYGRDDYKTDLVWQLTHSGDLYNYLSRPRRFGKSLLIDTLQCYFEGKKELFEGLKIMELEEEWTEYPVIRLDMSGAGATAAEIKDYLNLEFSKYEALDR